MNGALLLISTRVLAQNTTGLQRYDPVYNSPKHMPKLSPLLRKNVLLEFTGDVG